MSEQLKILRLEDVKDRSGISRSTIYRYMKAGTFPKAIKIGMKAVGWLEADVNSWIRSIVESSGGRA